VTGESAAKYKDYMTNLGAAGYFEKPIDFAKLKARLATELQKRPSERRAHVRVRMNLTLKLKGTDSSLRSFEQLTITENISAGGFLCPLPLSLSKENSLNVFICGAGRDQFVGRAQVVRTEAPDTPRQKCAFQFTERTADWILQD
jgi:hypothetical protein